MGWEWPWPYFVLNASFPMAMQHDLVMVAWHQNFCSPTIKRETNKQTKLHMQRQLPILHKTYHNCNTCTRAHTHMHTHRAAYQNNLILQANNCMSKKCLHAHICETPETSPTPTTLKTNKQTKKNFFCLCRNKT